MARYVTGRANNYLSSTFPALPYPFSFSLRFKPDIVYFCHLASVGKLISELDSDFIQVNSATDFCGVSTRGGAGFQVAQYASNLVAGQWYLAVAVFASPTSRTIYIDTSTQSGTNNNAVPAGVVTTKPFCLGGIITNGSLYPGGYGFDGQVADAAIWSVALTAADVDALAAGRPADVRTVNLHGWWQLGADGDLSSSVGTCPPMTVTGTCPVTADPTLPEPGGVYTIPDTYSPNTELSWVTKATHIWALHPTDPLKADKGGHTLASITGTVPPPVALPSPENTMEFHGGGVGTASYYKTIDTLILSPDSIPLDAPAVATSASMSLWVYPTSYTDNYTRFIGSYPEYYSPMMGMGSSGLPVVEISNAVMASVMMRPYQWTHLAATKDASSVLRIYVNGVKEYEAGDTSWGAVADYFSIGYVLREGLGGNFGLIGRMRQVMLIEQGVWTDAEILHQYQHPFDYYITTEPPVGAFTLTANAGDYALTGQALNFLRTYKVSFDAAAFILAGQTANLVHTTISGIVAGVGDYAFSGQSALLRSTRQLVSSPEAYTITGNAVIFQLGKMLIANPAGFVLTGTSASFVLSRGLLAEYGIYTLAGMDANLLYRLILAGGGRTFYVKREDRTLRIIRDIDIED